MTSNIAIVGSDPFNLDILRSLDRDYVFTELLTLEEIKKGGEVDFDRLLKTALRRLDELSPPADAVIGYWDFPVTSLVPVLCDRRGLPGPSLTSVLKCSHKYWSRLLQREAIPEATPDFAAVDPFDENAADSLAIEPPYWLKPIKATASALAFKIESKADLGPAIKQIREGIDRVGLAFDALLHHVDIPEHIAKIGGRSCIAEQLISGSLHTVSGYAHRGEITVYGVVDSIWYPETTSFQRYQYPSKLPQPTQERLADLSRRIMGHIGYDAAPFNIEYFYDEDRDDVGLLEINPRISQSHGEVYEFVDGVPNHRIMVELALGREPHFPRGRGPFPIAAKYFVKRFRDAHVRRVPSKSDIEAIQTEMPGVIIELCVEEGAELHDKPERDTESFELAYVFVGANNEDELLNKAHRVEHRLNFELTEPRS